MKKYQILLILASLLLAAVELQACRPDAEVQEISVSDQLGTASGTLPYASMNKLMKNYHWKSGVIGFSMGSFILPLLRTFIREPEAKALLGEMRKMHFLVMEKDAAEEELVMVDLLGRIDSEKLMTILTEQM